jgi:hypothetical protein
MAAGTRRGSPAALHNLPPAPAAPGQARVRCDPSREAVRAGLADYAIAARSGSHSWNGLITAPNGHDARIPRHQREAPRGPLRLGRILVAGHITGGLVEALLRQRANGRPSARNSSPGQITHQGHSRSPSRRHVIAMLWRPPSSPASRRWRRGPRSRSTCASRSRPSGGVHQPATISHRRTLNRLRRSHLLPSQVTTNIGWRAISPQGGSPARAVRAAMS